MLLLLQFPKLSFLTIRFPVPQIFAVIVTLYTQSDFIDGIFLITERWKAFKDVTTPVKFNISAIMRVLAGNVGIASTFVLVMYSTEVVDLLLNFTAMEFVATLDDSAFELAAKGFLGVTLEKKCLVIQDFRYQRKMRRGSWTRILLYGFYVFLVFFSFLVVVGLQATRTVGVDNEVYIQFDDSEVPELFGVSGVYKGCKGFRSSPTGGIGYVDVSKSCPEFKRGENIEFPGRSFVYCWSLDGWVFLQDSTETPCERGNYVMRSFLDEPSFASNSFDLLTHAKANWVIGRDTVGGEAILHDFFIDSAYAFPTGFNYCGEGGGLVRIDRPLNLQKTIISSPC
jgi:hypothetical protein